MLRMLARTLSGRTPRDKRAAKEREIEEVKSEIRNSIQAVQSGNRILQSLSGVVELNRREPST